MDAPFQECWIEAGGHRLYTRVHPCPDSSPAGREPIVFLHEGLGCTAFWRDVPEEIAQKTARTAVVFDRRGYGRSSPCTEARHLDYLHIEARTYLPAILDALAIERAVLVGHSDGGTIALLFAAAFPRRCGGIVTEAAHVLVDETTLAGIRQTVTAYQKGDLRQRLARHHREKTDAVFSSWADTWLAPWFRNWRITADIAAIACPVLAIQGRDDPYGDPVQLAAITAAVSGPARSLMLANCGHTPHLEARPAFVAAVTNFVSSLERDKKVA